MSVDQSNASSGILRWNRGLAAYFISRPLGLLKDGIVLPIRECVNSKAFLIGSSNLGMLIVSVM